MPGITDVAVVSGGVAVRGRTFGQCIDAVRALEVDWGPGTEDGKSDADVLEELRRAEIPLAVPKLGLLAKTVEGDFTFCFASNSALETNCAIADVRPDRAEIWAGPEGADRRAGGDRREARPAGGRGHRPRHPGRRLVRPPAVPRRAPREAAEISQAMGKPVKLMWHRTDDFRQGRIHPMSHLPGPRHVRAGQRAHATSSGTPAWPTDFGHGLGEIITASAAQPAGRQPRLLRDRSSSSPSTSPYNFGVTTQLLNEVDTGFNTGSMRNIYSPNVRVRAGADRRPAGRARWARTRYAFRRAFLKDDRARAVLDKVGAGRRLGADDGRRAPRRASRSTPSTRASSRRWSRSTAGRRPPGARSRTAYGGPRVTKVVCAVDVGPRDQPARPGGADDGRHHGRHRAGPDLQPAPAATAPSSRAAGTTTSTPGSGTPRRSWRSS